MRWICPSCLTSPSGVSVPWMPQVPPTTRAAPNSDASRSMCTSPFRSGITCAAGPIAGRIDSIAESRS